MDNTDNLDPDQDLDQDSHSPSPPIDYPNPFPGLDDPPPSPHLAPQGDQGNQDTQDGVDSNTPFDEEDEEREAPVFPPTPKPQAKPSTSPRSKAKAKARLPKTSPPARTGSPKPVAPKVTPLPPAITQHFRNDEATRPDKMPAGFFSYWKSLMDNPAYRDRPVVYVYRIFPLMKPGKYSMGKESEWISLEDFKVKYGAGDYNLKLNDMGNKYLMVTQCTIVGIRDWEQHPPVLNVDDLEVDDPINKKYIQLLRSRGVRLPGDQNYESPAERQQKEEMEMALVQQQEEQQSLTRDLVHTVIKQAETARSTPPPMDPSGQATAKGMEIVHSAATLSQEMMANTMGQIQALQSKSGDPLAVLAQAMEFAKSMTPNTNAATEAVTRMAEMNSKQQEGFQRQMFEIQQATITGLERRLEQMHTTQTQASAQPFAQPTAPANSLRGQLEELKASRDLLRDVLGLPKGKGSSDDEDEDRPSKSNPDVPGWLQYLPMIMQGVSLIGGIVANAMHNAAIARGTPGTPIPPPAPQAILTPEQMFAAQSGYTAGGGPVAGGYPTPTSAPPPGPPYSQPNPQSQPQSQSHPQPQPSGGDSLQDFVVFFKRIELPLLNCWSSGESGADFAGKLIDLGDEGFFDQPGGTHIPGRSVYDMVHGYGQSIVGLALKTYAPIYDVVKLNGPRWDQFLTDFFNAEEIWEREEQAEQSGQGHGQGQDSTSSQPQHQPISPTPEYPATMVPDQVMDSSGTPVPIAPVKRRRV